MSYSFNHKCLTCAKKDQCMDRHFIAGAISGIHQVWPIEKCQLGSGTVTLNCSRYEEMPRMS